MAKKESIWRHIGNAYVMLLAMFIAIFYTLNEHLDLNFSPVIIIPAAVIVTAVLIILERKVNISDYLILPVILLDGFFHLTSPLQNLVENSPDWVIAFNLYGGSGMPVLVHQFMAVFLVVTSAFFIYFLAIKKKNFYRYFYKYAIALVTLTIISISYVIKLYTGGL